MSKTKDASETYRIMPHTINGVTFYVLKIDSWCHTCILIMNSKEDAEKLITRDNKYTHLTEADNWVCTKFVELITTMLDNPFEYHIASRINNRETFFNTLDR